MSLIFCACGCGEQFEDRDEWGKKRKYVDGHNRKGKTHSPETIQKMRKPKSEKAKQNMSNAKKGIPQPRGEESLCWKGGTKLWKARSRNKRRGLGSNFLNEPFLNSEEHHINQNDIIYTPHEWNHIVSHNVYTGKNMDIVNSYAFFFIVQQNIQNLNSYFSEMKG